MASSNRHGHRAKRTSYWALAWFLMPGQPRIGRMIIDSLILGEPPRPELIADLCHLRRRQRAGHNTTFYEGLMSYLEQHVYRGRKAVSIDAARTLLYKGAYEYLKPHGLKLRSVAYQNQNGSHGRELAILPCTEAVMESIAGFFPQKDYERLAQDCEFVGAAKWHLGHVFLQEARDSWAVAKFLRALRVAQRLFAPKKEPVGAGRQRS